MVATCDYLDDTACDRKCTIVQVYDSCIPPVFSLTAYKWVGKFRDSRERLKALSGKSTFKFCTR
jgi:succinate dehydrogenase/fumarate reductase-like Fe-S protein